MEIDNIKNQNLFKIIFEYPEKILAKCSVGYYETPDHKNIGKTIKIIANIFDKDGYLLDYKDWIWEKPEEYYWWVHDNIQEKIVIF